jgi:hypothetical protein
VDYVIVAIIVGDFLVLASKPSAPIDFSLRGRELAVFARCKHSVEEVSRFFASNVTQIRLYRLSKEPIAFPSPPSRSERIVCHNDIPARAEAL